MKARSQSEHEAINRREYPGTRQLCERCGEPTERCEEDGIYTDSGEGPLCIECYYAANSEIARGTPSRASERLTSATVSQPELQQTTEQTPKTERVN